MLERRIHELLRNDRDYQAIQALDGVGRTLGAIFVTEIGDIGRFRSPEALCSWAGLTPRHRESDTKVVPISARRNVPDRAIWRARDPNATVPAGRNPTGTASATAAEGGFGLGQALAC